jgi:type I restriction enzyme M protein
MDLWAETMQDDVYLVAADGWLAAAKPRALLPVKDKNGKETWPEAEDFRIGKARFKADLIPPALLVARYFAREQAAIDRLESDAAGVAQEIEELVEEHAGDEGLLAEARNDADKITKASATTRMRAIKHDADAAEERAELQRYLDLVERESDLRAKLKQAQEALIESFAAKYTKLTEDEVKALVIDDKWLARLEAAMQGELDRVSQALTARVRELAERYATPLPKLVDEVDALWAKVEGHLKQMGALWN